jgi:hypothetical protein
VPEGVAMYCQPHRPGLLGSCGSRRPPPPSPLFPSSESQGTGHGRTTSKPSGPRQRTAGHVVRVCCAVPFAATSSALSWISALSYHCSVSQASGAGVGNPGPRRLIRFEARFEVQQVQDGSQIYMQHVGGRRRGGRRVRRQQHGLY